MRSHQGRTNHKQTGFTLVEVLLALAIFAYSASTILNVVGTSSNNLSEIEQITFASWVANDQLIELQTSEVWPPKNKEKGEQELAGRKWYWQQIVVETEDKSLRSVTMNVSTEKNAATSVYSLTTYLSSNVRNK